MSGGINHIDTASHFRFQKSERVVGSVLHTLEEKYEIPRSQFFLTSKQGFTSFDELENCPRDIEVKEVISQSGGKLKERDFLQGPDPLDKTNLEEQAMRLEQMKKEAEATGKKFNRE